MLARSKLNSVESKISEALINNEISHEDFQTIINEGKNIKNWKKALEWLKKAKIGINEVIIRNEIIIKV